MFHENQKVVCINDEKGWLSKEKILVKDDVYVVSMMCNFGKDVMLKGISGGWDKSRFRPLVDYWVENILSECCTEKLLA